MSIKRDSGKLLIGSFFFVIILPFFTYSFGNYLIKKEKVSWIKFMLFILMVFSLFSLYIFVFYLSFREVLEMIGKNKNK